MTLAEELQKLEQLHQNGSLTDTEFSQAKARLLKSSTDAGPGITALNGLRRSSADRWIGGVCGGLAVFTGTESWLWRLVFVVAFFCGGFGLLPYILLWIFVPLDQSA